MGFSAGGILSGEMLLNFDGTVNGTALDDSYVPDELDQVSADASACGMIYAFYGRLSVASTDVEKFGESDLPPTYFAYGTGGRSPAGILFPRLQSLFDTVETGIRFPSHRLRLDPTLRKFPVGQRQGQARHARHGE